MAAKIRPMDRFEFEVMSRGKPIDEAFRMLMRKSGKCMIARVDGEIAAVWGIARPVIVARDGHPWMAATDLIDRPSVRKEFLRRTRQELLALSGGFSHLWNLVYVENKIAIRFIKWIGFKFDPKPVDIGGHAFLRFYAGE